MKLTSKIFVVLGIIIGLAFWYNALHAMKPEHHVGDIVQADWKDFSVADNRCTPFQYVHSSVSSEVAN